MAKDQQSLFDKLFRDSQKQMAVFQQPNLPIIVWFVATLLSKLIGGDKAILDYLAFGALFTWAWLEIFQGDSLFRRILGLAIMTLLFINRI